MLESELAITIGVPRIELKELRMEKPEMTYKEGRSIYWTDEGVKWVKEKMGLETSQPLERSTYWASVVRSNYPNRKLVQVMADIRGIRELLLVSVRNADLFSRHMKVEIRQDGIGWALTRQPRQRGRF